MSNTVITPTITTKDPHEYREQMERIESFADGVHLDFADGDFAPSIMLPPKEAWRSEKLITHAHVMYRKPFDVIGDLVELDADLVILHAEAEELRRCLEYLDSNGTRTGVAILPETSVEDLQKMNIDSLFDHILVFGGHLGYQGGSADLSILEKVREVRRSYPDVEIGWDGGVNSDNAAEIAAAGVNVLNVGGYFKKANDPKKAYDLMLSLLQS